MTVHLTVILGAQSDLIPLLVKYKLLPFAFTGQIFSKHLDSLQLWWRVALDVIQDNSILPLQQHKTHVRMIGVLNCQTAVTAMNMKWLLANDELSVTHNISFKENAT